MEHNNQLWLIFSKYIVKIFGLTLTVSKVEEGGLEGFWREILASQWDLADLGHWIDLLHLHYLPANLDAKASTNRHSNYW